MLQLNHHSPNSRVSAGMQLLSENEPAVVKARGDRRQPDAVVSLGADFYGLHLRYVLATIEVSLEVMTQYLQTTAAVQMPDLTEAQIEAAAEALRRAMLDRHDLGFAVLLRTNFPEERLKEMAVAALRAAKLTLPRE